MRLRCTNAGVLTNLASAHNNTITLWTYLLQVLESPIFPEQYLVIAAAKLSGLTLFLVMIGQHWTDSGHYEYSWSDPAVLATLTSRIDIVDCGIVDISTVMGFIIFWNRYDLCSFVFCIISMQLITPQYLHRKMKILNSKQCKHVKSVWVTILPFCHFVRNIIDNVKYLSIHMGCCRVSISG